MPSTTLKSGNSPMYQKYSSFQHFFNVKRKHLIRKVSSDHRFRARVDPITGELRAQDLVNVPRGAASEPAVPKFRKKRSASSTDTDDPKHHLRDCLLANMRNCGFKDNPSDYPEEDSCNKHKKRQKTMQNVKGGSTLEWYGLGTTHNPHQLEKTEDIKDINTWESSMITLPDRGQEGELTNQ